MIFRIELGFLFQDVNVETPQGLIYRGKKHVSTTVRSATTFFFFFQSFRNFSLLDLWNFDHSSW